MNLTWRGSDAGNLVKVAKNWKIITSYIGDISSELWNYVTLELWNNEKINLTVSLFNSQQITEI